MEDATEPRRKKVRFAEEHDVVHVESRDNEGEAPEGDGEGERPQRCGGEASAALGMREAEDKSVMEDIEAAEEAYDSPEELYNDAGIPIEPFHLKREREEGYFDAEGNYIQYRRDVPDDAWLESLGAGPVELDDALLRRLRAKAAAAAAREADADGAAALGAGAVAAHKRRIAELLMAGETVLGALRRLVWRGGAGAC
ncbi:CD2 antigen cytoplasmic tail-binding protein 2 [Monoraphidium neglectum]|uniref:CD2 antigen cytoplasmic tail-binding protein 2 n=1 Tax=Monoraphidium neglectum TaxID=145388 RepID=A0A0D2KUI0_9CHLO|nr:CD2 antigen cytoplasmic tail-binding protein 2 [Monoraphidium neglectum]KIY99068.1 CD2 antigen cytoplasmic tail-binding protein 2 [Monoraphidium neglectum]|eukprot:XP_013898088.1 CD2 antigen cytoplasmic tail-binding protein 2 [Monoraphidium neglectum]